MKALYACDLHGRVNLYEEMTDMAARCGARIILLGGDLFPTIIPSPLALIGGSPDFQDDLSAQMRFVKDYLSPTLRSFLSSHPGTRIAYVPGNHDWIPAVESLESLLPEALNIHGQALSLDGMVLMGYACVTDSTFWVKDFARRDQNDDSYVPSKFAIVSDAGRLRPSPDGEYALREHSIEEELAAVPLEDPGRTICVFHCPPFDTGLDTLHSGKPIGSKSIRAFIEQTGPLLSLHGHVHEAPYMSGIYRTRIKDTLAANPGTSHDSLHALVFDTDDPAGTLTHSVFGRHVPAEVLQKGMPARRMRKIKAFFMKTVLKGK